MTKLESRLRQFAESHNFLTSKGPLCVALVVSRNALENGLPLDLKSLITKGKGQVLGLGKARVQQILAEYGIVRVLAQEGGRTSRGSMGNMQDYVEFLNALHQSAIPIDLQLVEKWWIERVREYFGAFPFHLRLDPSKSIKSCFQAVFDEAKK